MALGADTAYRHQQAMSRGWRARGGPARGGVGGAVGATGVFMDNVHRVLIEK